MWTTGTRSRRSTCWLAWIGRRGCARRLHHRRTRRNDQRNDRWTDVLAQRLQRLGRAHEISASPTRASAAIICSPTAWGQVLLARFDRDVLAPAGVRWVIVFEGVNDLGELARTTEVSAEEHAAMVSRVLAAYQQIVARAHARGLKIYGATITPYAGSSYYHPGPLSEADRQEVNQWIRNRRTLRRSDRF